MKGLLIKDFYAIEKQLRLFAILIIIFLLSKSNSMTALAFVYTAMIPSTALAFDEQSKWDQLAVMMPYTTRQLVTCKYLLCYIAASVLLVLTSGIYIVRSVLTATTIVPGTFAILILMSLIAVFLNALTMPLAFRLGLERGRIALFILAGVVSMVTAGLGEKLSPLITSLLQPLNQGTIWAFVLFAFTGVALLSLGSIRLSMSWYNHRFGRAAVHVK